MKPEFLFIVRRETEVVKNELVIGWQMDDIDWFLDEGQARDKAEELNAKKAPDEDNVTFLIRKEKFSDKEN